ncbi:cation:proton antiporter [Thiohalorhabdus denitrificans]|uniref:Multisubunit potassium/proton antiporter, PhaG subunit (TC 2.A.63.1.1) n=1 Tax=Thiohalorhabdus denitrificans TaxID=381306 RepID=A0A0P9EQ12_9GAMM|nr:Na+/H+ antiporter subunit G [Thiohalorhabdus denitrificans]KPV40593.1 cation:proton antiporter [Thiohalorhabdus denitrificans]SCY50205.1 multisubunit potassium/proton antiporter, PhaG subunit (TC 2.A.63.1.1) [Thiohalorhabdus denitrificans]
MVIELIVAAFLLIGAGFAFIGSLGLARFPDFYARLHGPTKATTLGVGGMLIASMVHFSTASGWSLHELLVILFLFLTAPVSAHLMAKAALHLEGRSQGSKQGEEPER